MKSSNMFSFRSKWSAFGIVSCLSSKRVILERVQQLMFIFVQERMLSPQKGSLTESFFGIACRKFCVVDNSPVFLVSYLRVLLILHDFLKNTDRRTKWNLLKKTELDIGFKVLVTIYIQNQQNRYILKQAFQSNRAVCMIRGWEKLLYLIYQEILTLPPSLFQIENGLLSPIPIVLHWLAPLDPYCQLTFCELTICL